MASCFKSHRLPPVCREQRPKSSQSVTQSQKWFKGSAHNFQDVSKDSVENVETLD